MNNKFYAIGRVKSGQKNKTEQLYSDYLESQKRAGEILWYDFECINLRLADKCFLCVDFFVMTSNFELQAHDVKGSRTLILQSAKVKMKVAAEKFPFRFFFAYPKPKKEGGGWVLQELGNDET